jgi:hypothetical protein
LSVPSDVTSTIRAGMYAPAFEDAVGQVVATTFRAHYDRLLAATALRRMA